MSLLVVEPTMSTPAMLLSAGSSMSKATRTMSPAAVPATPSEGVSSQRLAVEPKLSETSFFDADAADRGGQADRLRRSSRRRQPGSG